MYLRFHGPSQELRLRSRGEFLGVGTQDVPGLRAAGPIFPGGVKPTWIIKAAGPDSHHIGTRGARGEQRRPALSAEAASRNVAADGGNFVIARLAAQQVKIGSLHHHGRRVRGAAGALAIAAVTLDHRDRPRRALVANGAARTAAREVGWHIHGVTRTRFLFRSHRDRARRRRAGPAQILPSS
jgi:hypothetical protein